MPSATLAARRFWVTGSADIHIAPFPLPANDPLAEVVAAAPRAATFLARQLVADARTMHLVKAARRAEVLAPARHAWGSRLSPGQTVKITGVQVFCFGVAERTALVTMPIPLGDSSLGLLEFAAMQIKVANDALPVGQIDPRHQPRQAAQALVAA